MPGHSAPSTQLADAKTVSFAAGTNDAPLRIATTKGAALKAVTRKWLAVRGCFCAMLGRAPG